MLAALGVVMLYVGSLIEVVDISMAVIASLLCVIAVIEYGKEAPYLVFAVTAVLSLILLPNKTPALMYAFFFGYYPIFKEKYEKLKAPIAWTLKLVTFNVALVILMIVAGELMLGNVDIPIELFIIGIALSEIVFVVYDFALTRLISLYIYKIRKRIRFK